ncbi:MAG: BatD family protein, partial [Limisphaerales bacterium]
FWSAPFAYAIPKFTAALDRDTTSVGESVTLSLTFEGGAPATLPNIPTTSTLKIQHVGESSEMSIVNGQASSAVTHSYLLTPMTVGEFVIPALKVEIAGTRVTSPPLKLKVTAAPENSPTENKEAFLKLVGPKKEIYLGEIMPIELRLYFQNVRNVSLPQIPSDGLMVGNMPEKPEQTRVQMSGMTYNLAIFRLPISAPKIGTFSLGPATCSLTLLSGPRDFFGNFSQGRNITLFSESNIVQVLPLPEKDKPSTFKGAIGNFSLSLNASPTTVGVGDPITVKIQIKGRGSLDSLRLPEQISWREFKIYSPSSKIETTDPLGLEGAKNFELVVSPQNAGIKELPPFSFSFFDSEKKTYRTITHPAIPLTVRASAATPQPTVISPAQKPNENPAPPQEIFHIKPQLGIVSAVRPPLLQQPWFLILSSFAPLLWIGSGMRRQQKEKLASNPKLRRHREVVRIVEKGVQTLRRVASENKTEEFFALVFRLLQEQIGERLDLSATSITESILEEELKPRGLNPATLTSLHELFQSCNQARYAPQRTSQELAAYIPKVQSAIDDLKKLK